MMEDLSTDDVLKIFRLYIGLKLHFNSSKVLYHDEFRSDKINVNSMDSRKDIDVFIEVAKIYHTKTDEFKSILISLFRNNPDTWIGGVLEHSMGEIHTKRMANILNLTHVISRDVERVSDYLEVNPSLSLVDITRFNNDRPIIVKKLRLSDEFLALLDARLNYLGQETDNPLWKKRSFSLSKYKYLINCNEDINDLIDRLFFD